MVVNALTLQVVYTNAFHVNCINKAIFYLVRALAKFYWGLLLLFDEYPAFILPDSGQKRISSFSAHSKPDKSKLKIW